MMFQLETVSETTSLPDQPHPNTSPRIFKILFPNIHQFKLMATYGGPTSLMYIYPAIPSDRISKPQKISLFGL